MKERTSFLFENIANEWLGYRWDSLGAATRKGHSDKLKFFIEKFSDCYIDEMTIPQLQMVMNNKYKTGGMRGKEMARDTFGKYKQVLNMIFDFAIMKQLITFNAANYIQVPHNATRGIREGLKKTELAKFLSRMNYYNEENDYILWKIQSLAVLELFTGCRRSEALAINVNRDIDFENNLVRFNGRVLFDENKPYYKAGLKNSEPFKEVTLLPLLTEYFLPYKDLDEFFFADKEGNFYTKCFYNYHWKRYQEVEKISWTQHKLRHEYATLSYLAGVDLAVTQGNLGHRRRQVTLEIYTHIEKNYRKDEALKINDYILENYLVK